MDLKEREIHMYKYVKNYILLHKIVSNLKNKRQWFLLGLFYFITWFMDFFIENVGWVVVKKKSITSSDLVKD